jgi:hypothetical protein
MIVVMKRKIKVWEISIQAWCKVWVVAVVCQEWAVAVCQEWVVAVCQEWEVVLVVWIWHQWWHKCKEWVEPVACQEWAVLVELEAWIWPLWWNKWKVWVWEPVVQVHQVVVQDQTQMTKKVKNHKLTHIRVALMILMEKKLLI